MKRGHITNSFIVSDRWFGELLFLAVARSQEFIFGRILLVLIANQVSVSSAEGGGEGKRLIAIISCSLTLRYHCFEIIFPTNLQISVTRYFSALIICPLLSVWREWGVAGWSMSCQRISHKRLSLLWEGAALSLWLCWCCCWTSRAATATGAAAAGRGDGSPGSLGWLLSDKGPFQQSLEYTEAAERYQQGFSTRYKIYRWEVCVFNACVMFRVWESFRCGL